MLHSGQGDDVPTGTLAPPILPAHRAQGTVAQPPAPTPAPTTVPTPAVTPTQSYSVEEVAKAALLQPAATLNAMTAMAAAGNAAGSSSGGDPSLTQVQRTEEMVGALQQELFFEDTRRPLRRSQSRRRPVHKKIDKKKDRKPGSSPPRDAEDIGEETKEEESFNFRHGTGDVEDRTIDDEMMDLREDLEDEKEKRRDSEQDLDQVEEKIRELGRKFHQIETDAVSEQAMSNLSREMALQAHVIRQLVRTIDKDEQMYGNSVVILKQKAISIQREDRQAEIPVPG